MIQPIPMLAAEARLHAMVRTAGIDPDRPGPIAVIWPVFKEFAKQPVATASHSLLVQSGTYRFGGLEQLHCEFQFDPTPELRGLGATEEWWFSHGDVPLEGFFAGIERRPDFQAVQSLAPVTASVWQEAV